MKNSLQRVELYNGDKTLLVVTTNQLCLLLVDFDNDAINRAAKFFFINLGTDDICPLIFSAFYRPARFEVELVPWPGRFRLA